ncbi:hypothetical protein CBER1_07081 [Cercospora berteroae]|uniref:Cupin type-1 domain-containing protein n=1 Tax=Cercospora berteroae TaxID=357750 RepID=A0A2S6BTS3_9PEZI|nr:hypothetical protein CBER1_07081 [Cercospora berteroae]
MVHVKIYHLPPTPLIPNNPYPLLHYPGLLTQKHHQSPSTYDPSTVYQLFHSNNWLVQWIFRYGSTQQSHYHSAAHECMAVLSGTATIRFGVADTSSDLEANTHGEAWEKGGIEIQAKAGDVFVLPAGLAHKTFDTKPEAEFGLLTPGRDENWIAKVEDPSEVLKGIKLEGFTMLGAYPVGSAWDFAVGQEDDGKHFRDVWKVPKPERDPVLGTSGEGLVGLWKEERKAAKL